MSLKYSKGGAWVPPRVVIYGDEKVGKTSTAAQAPKPLYLGTDDGRRRLEVASMPIPATWQEFVDQLQQVATDAPGEGFRSVVIDTLNGVVDLAVKHVTDTQFGGKYNDPKNGFLSWGGKQGWSAVSEEVRKILGCFDQLIDASLWVILLAHSSTQKVQNPVDGDYDRFAPAINPLVWARVGQWADVILRVDYDISVIEIDGGKKRAVGDETRLFRCSASVGEISGCRAGYELPPTMPFAWSEIEERLGNSSAATLDAAREQIAALEGDDLAKALKYLGIKAAGELSKAPTHKVKALTAKLASRSSGE